MRDTILNIIENTIKSTFRIATTLAAIQDHCYGNI